MSFCLYSLSKSSERIWNKLLLLSKGDVDILYRVFDSQKNSYLTMTEVISTIQTEVRKKELLHH